MGIGIDPDFGHFLSNQPDLRQLFEQDVTVTLGNDPADPRRPIWFVTITGTDVNSFNHAENQFIAMNGYFEVNPRRLRGGGRFPGERGRPGSLQETPDDVETRRTAAFNQLTEQNKMLINRYHQERNQNNQEGAQAGAQIQAPVVQAPVVQAPVVQAPVVQAP